MIKNSSMIGLVSGLMLAGSVNGADLTVTVTNITNGMVFTNPFVSAHPEGNHIFQVGQAASSGLQLIAECGSSADLKTQLDAVGANNMDAADVVVPGGEQSINLSNDALNTHLSIATMLLPTNDAFAGLDSIEIPKRPGTYTYFAAAYDAGTEANDEIRATAACAPGVSGFPMEFPGVTGTEGAGVMADDANGKVHIHRGALGDGNATGGVSDLDNAVHRWQNPVLKITLTVK